MSSRFTLLRRLLPQRIVGSRSLSLTSINLKVDPSKLVHGVTIERMVKDPELAEYMRANFPEAFDEGGGEGGTAKDELNINIAELLGRKQDVEEEDKPAVGGFEKRVETVYPRNIRPLTTYLRDAVREDGTRNSKRLRYHEGLIPGLLLGGSPDLGIFSHLPDSKIFVKTPWPSLQRELDRYHRSFESRVYDLTILEGPDDDSGGTVHRVTPQNVQRHPVMSTIYCANFLRYHAGRPLKLPIRYINQEESTALKRDGFIVPIQRFVECFIDEGVDIPEAIDFECTGLRVKEVMRVGRFIIPDGVRLSDRVKKQGNEFIIGVVYGKGRGDDEEDAAAAAETKKEGSGQQQKAAAAATQKTAAAGTQEKAAAPTKKK